jgi:hypothetical protein
MGDHFVVGTYPKCKYGVSRVLVGFAVTVTFVTFVV